MFFVLVVFIVVFAVVFFVVVLLMFLLLLFFCLFVSLFVCLFCFVFVFSGGGGGGKSFSNTIKLSNGLDPDQYRRSVGPDLGPNCLRRLTADDQIRRLQGKV